MKILHLTLKKKWFDMILSGEKKDEYREIKPYWKRRLTGSLYYYQPEDYANERIPYTHFDKICFRNGYGKYCSQMLVEYNGLLLGKGKEEWGGNGDYCFVLKLGKIIETKNIKSEKVK